MTGLALYYAVKSQRPERAGLGLLAWTFNPYVLLVNEMWAPVDMLPTFLMFLAFVLILLGRRTVLSALSLGLAIAIKLFPLMTLPIFLAVNNTPHRRKMLVAYLLCAFMGAAAYFAWVASAGYSPWIQLKQYDVFTQYFDEFTLSTLDDSKIGIATIALISTSVLILEKWPKDCRRASDAATLLLLTFFAFGNWFPQFLLWLIPFLTLDFAAKRRPIIYLLTLVSSAFFIDVVAFYSYFTSNGSAFFFVPADTSTLKAWVTGYEQFARNDIIILLGGPLARASFSAICVLYAVKIIEENTMLISTLIRDLAHHGSISRVRSPETMSLSNYNKS